MKRTLTSTTKCLRRFLRTGRFLGNSSKKFCRGLKNPPLFRRYPPMNWQNLKHFLLMNCAHFSKSVCKNKPKGMMEEVVGSGRGGLRRLEMPAPIPVAFEWEDKVGEKRRFKSQPQGAFVSI